MVNWPWLNLYESEYICSGPYTVVKSKLNKFEHIWKGARSLHRNSPVDRQTRLKTLPSPLRKNKKMYDWAHRHVLIPLKCFHDLMTNSRYKSREVTYEMLCRWKIKEGSDATLSALISHLLAIEYVLKIPLFLSRHEFVLWNSTSQRKSRIFSSHQCVIITVNWIIRQKDLAEELADLYYFREDDFKVVNLPDSGRQTDSDPSGSGSSRQSKCCLCAELF